jgi:hypothetical protein
VLTLSAPRVTVTSTLRAALIKNQLDLHPWLWGRDLWREAASIVRIQFLLNEIGGEQAIDLSLDSRPQIVLFID